LSQKRGQVHPDSTSLYVPSVGLIVAGDVVYNQCRMYVGDTTPESRMNWIAALDGLAALNPAMVVAGHKKPGAPDSPSTIRSRTIFRGGPVRTRLSSRIRCDDGRNDQATGHGDRTFQGSFFPKLFHVFLLLVRQFVSPKP
jgi:glyoxylase-like metal-dependent hydrolase (beta-lactamase superfamily II)